jgi:hypothetical protein
MLIIGTSPTPPIGAYLPDQLCGQTGIIPTSASIKITSKIAPSEIIRSSFNNDVESKIDGLRPLKNALFYPISVSGSNFNP